MSEKYKTQLMGINNPNYKNSENIKTCLICKKDFDAGYNIKTRKVCSKECSHKLTSIRFKGVAKTRESVQKRLAAQKKNVNPKTVCLCGNNKSHKSKQCQACRSKSIASFAYCKQCNEKFRKKNSKRIFCSKKCLDQYKEIYYSGTRNPNWKGGIKPENQRQRNHVSYKQWRLSVFERDNYTCQDCGQVGGQLHAHHIEAFSTNKELRTDIKNGKTVCIECHNKYHPKLKLTKKRKAGYDRLLKAPAC